MSDGSHVREYAGSGTPTHPHHPVSKQGSSCCSNISVVISTSVASLLSADTKENITEEAVHVEEEYEAKHMGEFYRNYHEAHCETSKERDDKDIELVLQGNNDYIKRMTAIDPSYFLKLKAGQKPKYLWIGCADSRVPANQLLSLGPGEVFVHRNIANLVCGQDLNFLSVLQYAVEVLEVPHIIVCGHYDCGGVKAATQKQDLGLIENWLRLIRDVQRYHCEELAAIADEDQRLRRLVELNVKEQVMNVFKTASVQKRRKATLKLKPDGSLKGRAYPRVHGLVYDIGEGKLKKLDIKFAAEIKKYSHIYDLY
jgi:carbonic anhydrase